MHPSMEFDCAVERSPKKDCCQWSVVTKSPPQDSFHLDNQISSGDMTATAIPKSEIVRFWITSLKKGSHKINCKMAASAMNAIFNTQQPTSICYF